MYKLTVENYIKDDSHFDIGIIKKRDIDKHGVCHWLCDSSAFVNFILKKGLGNNEKPNGTVKYCPSKDIDINYFKI